jgi:hypothetical protein
MEAAASAQIAGLFRFPFWAFASSNNITNDEATPGPVRPASYVFEVVKVRAG